MNHIIESLERKIASQNVELATLREVVTNQFEDKNRLNEEIHVLNCKLHEAQVPTQTFCQWLRNPNGAPPRSTLELDREATDRFTEQVKAATTSLLLEYKQKIQEITHQRDVFMWAAIQSIARLKRPGVDKANKSRKR